MKRTLKLAAMVAVALFFVWAIGRAVDQQINAAVVEKPRWMSTFAWRVGTCESGTRGSPRPNFRHDGGDYEGFVGWYWGTWLLDAPAEYPRRAYLATPRQQYRVFQISVARGRYFGCIANRLY